MSRWGQSRWWPDLAALVRSSNNRAGTLDRPFGAAWLTDRKPHHMPEHVFAELYVRDLDRSIDIFVGLLGMRTVRVTSDFAELHHGDAGRLLLNSQPIERFEPRNPIRALGEQAARGAGLELVVVVSDLARVFERVTGSGLVEVVAEMAERSWGATDFRFLHPDGFYVRVSD